MAPESPQSQFEALMRQQQFDAALRFAQDLHKKQPRNGQWPYLSARAAFAAGNLSVAHDEIAKAARLLPNEAPILLQQAIIDHRLGRTASALDRLAPLLGTAGLVGREANITHAEILSRSNRQDELDALLSKGGVWLDDPRSQILVARRLSARNPSEAVALFTGLLRSDAPMHARRISGFEAVKILDREGRYREAFDLAGECHAKTHSRYDIGLLEAQVEEHRRLLDRPASLASRRAPEVKGVALVAALPRSGTTLVEQMFDRHERISGIGEYRGVQAIGAAAITSGYWPEEVASLSAELLEGWQGEYLKGAHLLMRKGTDWAFDKTLQGWLWMPLLSVVLPGAVYIAIDRDPRDNAISMFLGNFHPQSMGWTGSMESIRRAMTAHRTTLPDTLQRLELPHEAMVYEDFVTDPRGHAERCFAKLGLPMDNAALEPEQSQRMVLTLSHEQVRKPINPGSIGRWRNYEWAFDAAWQPLADAHDKRRRL